MRWTKTGSITPAEGFTGLVLLDAKLPKDEWYSKIATFCDGIWYELDYDDHLGVLRKVPVHGNVIAYADYITPDWNNEL